MRRLVAAAAALASAVAAAGADERQARWYLQVDNDSILGNDRWYSSGVRLGRAAGAGPVRREWGVLHEIYTPEAKHWRPGVDDRSPTARLMAYGARHRSEGSLLETIELGAGVRGPSARGRQVTQATHELIDAAEIDWSRQDHDRADVQLAAVRSHGLGRLQVHYGGVAGTTQAFLHGGVEWRAGGGAALAASTSAMRYAATPPPPATGSSWAAFAGAGVRAVARNAMIRRNYDPLGRDLEPRRAVGRAIVGLAWVHHPISATLAIVGETREFDAQRTAHRFWSLAVHAEF